MRAKFFRHLIGGIAIGVTFAAITVAGLVWVIQPDTASLPWTFAFVALFQMAAMGGVVGIATFLRSILKEADNGDPGSGGLKLPLPEEDHPIVEGDLTPQPA